MGLVRAWLPGGAALQSIDHCQTDSILQDPLCSFKQNFDKIKARRTGSTGGAAVFGAATLKYEFPGATPSAHASSTLQATLQDPAHCPSAFRLSQPLAEACCETMHMSLAHCFGWVTQYGVVETSMDLTLQVKAVQRYALWLLLCAWVTAVSAVSYPSLGDTRALAAAGNGSLSAGQSLGQVIRDRPAQQK